MAYSGLTGFITALEEKNELLRIKTFTDPILEITEITDRVTKSGGKALLFENTGTEFPDKCFRIRRTDGNGNRERGSR
jgi:4-hydroxy-3-polyprenylbenzoate decarboxylase